MFDNRSVRTKFMVVAAAPASLLVAVAAAAAAGVAGPLLLVVALVAAVASLALGLFVGWSVRRRLVELAATIGVPDQVLGRSDSDEVSTNEIGDLDRAIEHLVRSEDRHAADLSIWTANLREMITAQSGRQRDLLDRQIERVDWMESTEEDPDRLQHLYELDHLAVRARQRCESLLVAAGGEPAYSRPGPAPAADVVRVAAGENSRYRDVTIHTLDDAMIDASAACELSHLLGELLENATGHSPEHQSVDLHATLLQDGAYRIMIIDSGTGMTEAQLAQSRSIIAEPPEIQLSTRGSIGLAVVGRLARRIGASVDLTPTSPSGLTVEILIPAEVVAPAERSASPSAKATAVDKSAALGEWTAPSVQSSADQPLLGRSEPVSSHARPSPSGEAETLDEALAIGAPIESDILGALKGAQQQGDQLIEGPVVSTQTNAVEESPGRDAAKELGLTRRQRTTAPSAVPAGRVAQASSRKPEEVRSMITKYRDGLKARPESSDDEAT